MPCCCSGAQSYMTICNPMNCSTSGFPVLHHLLEFAQTHVSWISDAIQPSHPLSPPSPPSLSLSQHQGVFQWVSSSHQVAKVLEPCFSISPSNKYSGLISLRIEWFDLLAVQGTLKSNGLYPSPDGGDRIVREFGFIFVSVVLLLWQVDKLVLWSAG